jgi:hypothetical protein
MALPLMILSFVAIGGFLFWLSRTAEPTSVAVVEEGGSSTAAAAGGMLVGWNDFGANPGSYEGQMITLRPVRVASVLGQGAFWTQLPNETPFLINQRIEAEFASSFLEAEAFAIQVPEGG